MMSDKNLDDFLRVFQSETDREPSLKLRDNILSVPEQATQRRKRSVVHPRHWFDLMIPKAIGWALTCGLGIYVGLSSSDLDFIPTDEEYYMYDQAQVLLSGDLAENLAGNLNGEEID